MTSRFGLEIALPTLFRSLATQPAGFNLVDVMAWGAIGHALGYFALATHSLAASPIGSPVPF